MSTYKVTMPFYSHVAQDKRGKPGGVSKRQERTIIRSEHKQYMIS